MQDEIRSGQAWSRQSGIFGVILLVKIQAGWANIDGHAGMLRRCFFPAKTGKL